MAELSVLRSGFDHPEGIAWDPAGAVIVGGEAGQLYRATLDGAGVEVLVETGGFVLGVALDGRGRIYWCDLKFAEVRSFDPATGIVASVSAGAPERPLAVPNFPVFDASGRLYVSDSGHWGSNDGAIFAIDPDGSTTVASTQPSAYTNGLAIDPEGSHLYVVESSLPGVSRLPISSDGSLGTRELVVELPRSVPDGIAFTADGQLLVACYRPDAVLIWDGTGVETLAEDWTGLTLCAPTNIAFIGPALARLVTANLGSYHLTELMTKLVGLPLRYPTVAP